MATNVDKLKDGYQSVEAPSFLATRIRAEVKERSQRRRGWLPAGAILMSAFAVFWLLPTVIQVTTDESRSTKLSLSAIANLKPKNPTGESVSLTKVRSVPRPSMPARPRITRTKPQARLEIENDLKEEKEDVLI